MRFSAIAVSAVWICTTAIAAAQVRERPIRMVTSEVGSGTDLVARLLAQGLAPALGQSIIVDNRAVNGSVEIVAKAQPDGYSLLFSGSTAWLTPFLRSKVSYDPVRDFAPISLATSSPSVLVVHPAVPANSVKELIALAKARPGELNYSSGSIGGSAHLSAELFNRMAGVSIVRVQYKGSAPSLNAVIAGEVQLMFPSGGSVTPHAKSGRLKLLAVSSARPSTLAPGLPTFSEAGLPGYVAVSTQGLFAPAGTPAPVIDRLHRETAQFLRRSEVKDKLLNAGLEAVGSTPQDLSALVQSDMATLGKLIRDLVIKEN